MAKQLSESEKLVLIRNYGECLSRSGTGMNGTTRADIIEWADRIKELAAGLPRKNSAYLRDE